MTKNNLVITSTTQPVCRIKSPFLCIPSFTNKQPARTEVLEDEVNDQRSGSISGDPNILSVYKKKLINENNNQNFNKIFKKNNNLFARLSHFQCTITCFLIRNHN